MKNGWVLLLRCRSCDDEVLAFATRDSAESSALAFAKENWPQELGDPPATYDDAVRAWESGDVWGSEETNWELMNLPVMR